MTCNAFSGTLNPTQSINQTRQNVRQYLTQVSVGAVLHCKERERIGSEMYNVGWDLERSDDVWMT